MFSLAYAAPHLTKRPKFNFSLVDLKRVIEVRNTVRIASFSLFGYSFHNSMETDGTTTQSGSEEVMSVFRPPILRSAGALNRALFSKTINLAAATVNDPRHISKYRKALTKSRDILNVPRVTPVISEPETLQSAQGRKCLLLRPDISASEETEFGWDSALLLLLADSASSSRDLG